MLCISKRNGYYAKALIMLLSEGFHLSWELTLYWRNFWFREACIHSSRRVRSSVLLWQICTILS